MPLEIQKKDKKYFIFKKYEKYNRSRDYYCSLFFVLNNDYISQIIPHYNCYTCGSTYVDTLNYIIPKINFPKLRKDIEKRVFNILKYEYKVNNKGWLS